MHERTGAARKRRVSAAARTAFAAVGCCICLVTTRSPATEPAELPNTAAGRCAADYFDAFNTGKNELMQSFFEGQYALSYLENHPLDQRSAYYERIHGVFGQLTPLRAALSMELQLTLLADAAKTDNVLVALPARRRAPPSSGLRHVQRD